ncbi:alcohol dehydrogenase catalytic domain-containing protein [Hamadaea tsunoensis]|uniref:alcohol dehydrogenase catalytic domain-containing protein n=1 Tax=Hamadaea tsunoensis TaxID=53368 RepID=UPI00042731D8|nr:alcohol dehydrogenase catalytic domain-containing protein [Hamadaea tsunoensis]
MTEALLARADGTLSVESIVVPPPGPGQVRVQVKAAGVCHSDLSMINGTLKPEFPLVLGHEAAGVVTETAPDVTLLAIGDHVVLNWSPACRRCWFCAHGEPWLCETTGIASFPRGSTADGEPLHVTLGLGALATEVVLDATAAVRVPEEVAWEAAALLGCAVLTGSGAVRNTARVRPGEAVAVIGLGGVGLSTLLAARAAGADPLIAVDVSPAKEELARRAGATDFLVADDQLTRTIRGLTGGRGVDHALECAGKAAGITAAWKATRRGGKVTVLGIGRKDDVMPLSALDVFHSSRTLKSSVYGESDPDRDLPAIAEAVARGELDLSVLISHRAGLEGAAAAFDRMRRGEGARTVILFP